MFYLVILSILLVLLLISRGSKRDIEYPPGPKGIPVLGSVWQLLKNPYKQLQDYADRYGSFYTLKIGPVKCLILNDIQTINEAFSLRSEEFGARPAILRNATGMGNIGLVLLQPGAYHKQEKKKAMSLLRGLGAGSDKFDDTMQPYIQRIMSLIGDSPRKINLKNLCSAAMTDIIGGITFGDSFYNERSETCQKIRKLISKNFQNNPALILVGKHLPLKLKQWLDNFTDMESNISKMGGLLHGMIKSLHHKEEQHQDILNSFVFRYAEEYASSHDGQSLYGNQKEESQLVGLIVDFFQAGCETTAVNLEWLLLLLAANPDVQQQAQQELASVFGKDPPTLKERRKLKYITALITEGLRIRPPAPLGAPHSTMRDVKFHSYTIPAGTPVLGNYISAHHNPNDFPDPHQFKPERFLNNDSDEHRSKRMISFGIGPRSCAGEQLARSIMGSLIIHILHKYNLSSKDGEEVDLSFKAGINLVPNEKEVFICPREAITPL